MIRLLMATFWSCVMLSSTYAQQRHWIESYVENNGGCRSYKDIFSDLGISKMISSRPREGLSDRDTRAFIVVFKNCIAELVTPPDPEEITKETLRIDNTVFQMASSLPKIVDPPKAVSPSQSAPSASIDNDAGDSGSQATVFQRGRGVSDNDLLRYVDRLKGWLVTPLYINACFAYDGKYVCTGAAPSIKGRILVIADEFTNQQWKNIIDSRCHNLNTAIGCRPKWISFVVERYGTDMSGTVRTVYTNKIHASNRD